MTEPTKALAVVTPTTEPIAVRGVSLTTFDDLQRFAKAAAASGYFKDARDAAQAIVKVQYGLELGIPPIAAMQGIFFFDGKLTVGATLIASRIKASGKYDYRIARLDNTACVLHFFERIDGKLQQVGESSFSVDDAKTAGVAGKNNWKNYPRNMVFARAISNGARWYCPDVFSGPVYTPEEIGDGAYVDVIPDESPVVDPPTPQKAAPTITPEEERAKLLNAIPAQFEHLGVPDDERRGEVARIIGHGNKPSLDELRKIARALHDRIEPQTDPTIDDVAAAAKNG